MKFQQPAPKCSAGTDAISINGAEGSNTSTTLCFKGTFSLFFLFFFSEGANFLHCTLSSFFLLFVQLLPYFDYWGAFNFLLSKVFLVFGDQRFIFACWSNRPEDNSLVVLFFCLSEFFCCPRWFHLH